jgi:hypothetical protein
VTHPLARGPTGEQPAEHLRLGRGGVLVLVQQHHPVRRPDQLAHRRHLLRKPRGDGHLVSELDHPEPLLEPLVGDHQAGQLQSLVGGGGGLLQVGVHVAVAVEGCRRQLEQVGVGVRVQLGHRDQVLLQVGVEPQHPLGHRGRAEPGDVLERTGGVPDHPRGQPVAGGAGDHGRVGLVAEAQPVLGHQPRGEGVVRHDQLLAAGVHPVGRHHTRTLQGRPDPERQLRRRLAGEGQTQHLLGADLTRADQPDDAGGHHRGLAGAGTRDDHARLQRCRDRRQLLVGERDGQGLGQLLRGAEDGARPVLDGQVEHAHRTTCRPAG